MRNRTKQKWRNIHRACGVALWRQKWLRNLYSDLLHFMHRNVRYYIKCSVCGKTTTAWILVRITSFRGEGLIIYLRCTILLLLVDRTYEEKRERVTSGNVDVGECRQITNVKYLLDCMDMNLSSVRTVSESKLLWAI